MKLIAITALLLSGCVTIQEPTRPKTVTCTFTAPEAIVAQIECRKVVETICKNGYVKIRDNEGLVVYDCKKG